ncbi:hypothetical protein OXX80_006696, partial [Metschnikowia pulcherrima]
KPKKSVSFA